MSGYPGAYLRWQARDVLRGPGIVAAIIAGFFAFVVWRLPAGAAGAAGAATLLGAYLQQVGWPMVLVATGEMVRSDRTEGYYRFYFARPIQPSLFYLVRFLLGFALVLAVVGVAAFAVWARTGTSGLDGRLLGQVGLTYLLLGGLVFLLSTVTTSGPRDWLIALIIQVFQAMSSELLATGVMTAAVAAVLAAGAMVLSRVLTMKQAYRAVSWTTVVLVAGMIPVSVAVEQSGAAGDIAEVLVDVVGDGGPYALLFGLFIITAVFGQLISNTATALIMIPIAVTAATDLGVSVRPVLMSLTVAAAAAFLTPVATPANLMIMEPAGYRFADYWKLGSLMLLLFLGASVLLVPVFWAF